MYIKIINENGKFHTYSASWKLKMIFSTRVNYLCYLIPKKMHIVC